MVLAHAFVTGAVAGGSERSIAVGGVESVTADVFDGFDYVALGHLHGSQRVTERIRYSGSPLPYAFSEAGQTKSVLLVDLDPVGRGDGAPARPAGDPAAGHRSRDAWPRSSNPQQISRMPTCRSS